MFENQCAGGGFVMFSFFSDFIAFSQLLGEIIHEHYTVITILPINYNFSVFSSGLHFHAIVIPKAKLTRLVIVDDGDFGSGIMSEQLLPRSRIVKLHEKVLIRLPVIVINDFDINRLVLLALLEVEDAVEGNVIVVGNGFSVNGLREYGAGVEGFVLHLN